jgi:HlyD family secretion protein
MKKKIAIIGIVVVILAAAFLVNQMRERKEEGVMLLSGNVEVTETNVGFKIPGRVMDRPVDEGYKVKAGDVLARLDSSEAASIVSQGRAAVAEAATRLAELKAGSRSQEIEQAKANVGAQEAELVRVKKEYERSEVLHRNGAISTLQFDAAQSAYEARVSLLRNAEAFLSLAKEGPRREEIQMAEYRVQQVKAALTTSGERLKDTVIYSPVRGVILKKNRGEGGDGGSGDPGIHHRRRGESLGKGVRKRR